MQLFANLSSNVMEDFPLREQKKTSQSNLWLEKLNNYLFANLNDPNLTNADLAKEMEISERTFYSRVKSYTGQSPNHYLREIRLDQAKSLLRSGSVQTVKEAAYEVGFIDVEYFSGLFRKKFGLYPNTFLKEI